MTARNRTRDLRTVISGTYHHHSLGLHVPGSAYVGMRETCDDTIGERDTDNPFNLIKRSSNTPRLYGKYYDDQGQLAKEFDGYPLDWQVVPSSPHLPQWSDPDLVDVAHRTAALTNPSRGYVNLPQFLGELRDVPGLWKSWLDSGKSWWRLPQTADNIIRQSDSVLPLLPRLVHGWGVETLRLAANANLSYKFALQPTFRDLQNMLRFADASFQRAQYLKRLSEGKHVKSRVNLFDDEYTVTQDNVIIQSQGAIVKATRTTNYTIKEWSTCRWYSTWPFAWASLRRNLAKPNLHLQLDDLVKSKNLHGVLEAWWELIPWSWLSDWFVNVGQYIKANNNTLPVSISGICFMRTLTSKSTYKITQKPAWVSVQGEFFEQREDKVRIPIPKALVLFPPLAGLRSFSSAQLSILGSLAVLKGIR